MGIKPWTKPIAKSTGKLYQRHRDNKSTQEIHHLRVL